MPANENHQPTPAANQRHPLATTIDAALPLLRRPFSPTAVRAKVQNQDRAKPPSWGQVIRYIDARLVSERLNLVAGGQWSYDYAPLDPALRPRPTDDEPPPLHVVCSLTVPLLWAVVDGLDVGHGGCLPTVTFLPLPAKSSLKVAAAPR